MEREIHFNPSLNEQRISILKSLSKLLYIKQCLATTTDEPILMPRRDNFPDTYDFVEEKHRVGDLEHRLNEVIIKLRRNIPISKEEEQKMIDEFEDLNRYLKLKERVKNNPFNQLIS